MNVAVIRLNQMLDLPREFVWLEPWSGLTDDSDPDALEGGQIQAELESGQAIAAGLVAELRREMPNGHKLSGCELRVIGRCDADHNEFLFATNDPSAPIAFVHLTWRVESDANWPYTVVYATLDDWVAQMKRENDGFSGNGD